MCSRPEWVNIALVKRQKMQRFCSTWSLTFYLYDFMAGKKACVRFNRWLFMCFIIVLRVNNQINVLIQVYAFSVIEPFKVLKVSFPLTMCLCHKYVVFFVQSENKNKGLWNIMKRVEIVIIPLNQAKISFSPLFFTRLG